MDGFMAEALAAFLGAGLAIPAVRYLSDSALGHWLAKGLAKYSATVETEEVRRRSAFERLDRGRADIVRDLMNSVGRASALRSIPVAHMNDREMREQGAVFLHLSRARELEGVATRAVERLDANAHLLDSQEPLFALANAWQVETASDAETFGLACYEKYADFQAAGPPSDEIERGRQLNELRVAYLTKVSQPARLAVVQRCRELVMSGDAI